MNNDQIIESFPAYRIVERAPLPAYKGGCIEILAGETIGIKRRGHYDQFMPGSVVSYAMKNGQCPIRALERARANGHDLHWIIAKAVSLSSRARPQYDVLKVEIGQRVRFEGRIFTITAERNENLGLAEVDAATLEAEGVWY